VPTSRLETTGPVQSPAKAGPCSCKQEQSHSLNCLNQFSFSAHPAWSLEQNRCGSA
jgi:hypothetical protein